MAMSPAVKCLSVDTLISVMNKVEFKYLFKFSKNSGRIAEWSALQTGKRGDPGSIPAKVKTFYSKESSLEQQIVYRFEWNEIF